MTKNFWGCKCRIKNVCVAVVVVFPPRVVRAIAASIRRGRKERRERDGVGGEEVEGAQIGTATEWWGEGGSGGGVSVASCKLFPKHLLPCPRSTWL